ncbi:FkbM family methyltransferase [Synechococcus sp. SYN20]|uniref:FkbM family methyltransferase n=1 Tax=Synechococcus sp. SYN20 TaxID=1050714 RepID=UPI002105C0F3|nr:FkbM family methyltransferase [Synechococcus sp. SYN20]
MEFGCIFDVGANIGQSIDDLKTLSRQAIIHSFEPSPSAYRRLSMKYSKRKDIILNNVALSNQAARLLFNEDDISTMNRLSSSGTIEVECTTLDSYCDKHKIKKLSYLKVDTEGNELKVLEGGCRIIASTDFIELEASMNPYNNYHQSYSALSSFLFDRDFFLFGIFGQTHEWGGGGSPIIRRVNPVFVHQRVFGRIPTGAIIK